MKLIFEDDKQRRVIGREELYFSAPGVGLYLIEVSARAKNRQQLGRTDDEDLRVEIDGRKFPKLDNPQRYLDSPATFSGAALKKSFLKEVRPKSSGTRSDEKLRSTVLIRI